MSARTFAWITGAAGASALAREALRVGPRHADDLSGGGAALAAANAAGGAVASAVTTLGLGMVPARRSLYVLMGAIAGAALPSALAVAAPVVRQQLRAAGGATAKR